jgi:hypothetical protein
MTSGNRRPSAKVLAADVHEVGINTEGCGECWTVHGLPRGLELTDNRFERGSITRR